MSPGWRGEMTCTGAVCVSGVCTYSIFFSSQNQTPIQFLDCWKTFFFSKMTWNNREIVTNTWSYTFSWRPRCLVRRRPVLLRVSFLYLAGQSPFMIFHLVTSLKPKFALWRRPAFLGNWLNAILLEIIALKLET